MKSHGFNANTISFRHLKPDRAPHRHLDIELNLATGASAVQLVAGNIYEIPEGQIFAFWAGAPHLLLAQPGQEKADLHWITLPMAWLREWEFTTSFLGALLRGELITARLTPHDESDFSQWVSFIRNKGQRKVIASHEIQARLLRLQIEFLAASQCSPTPGKVTPLAVTKMLAYMGEHYTSPFSIEKMASEVGLHPNYAMGLFKHTLDQTISQYLRELRLHHTARELIISDAPIAEIAFEAGFSSLSRFYDGFKSRWNTTPRKYRALHHQKASAR